MGLNGTAGIHGDLRAGDDVSLGNNPFVTGTITNPDAFTTGSGATFGSHVTGEPDLPTLPAATVFLDGTTSQSVGNNATMTLAPGSYLNITLGGAATLNLTAGDYFLNRLMAGNGLTINVDLTSGDVNIFVTDFFRAGGISAMNLTGGTFQNVNVETHHVGVNAFLVAAAMARNGRATCSPPPVTFTSAAAAAGGSRRGLPLGRPRRPFSSTGSSSFRNRRRSPCSQWGLSGWPWSAADAEATPTRGRSRPLPSADRFVVMVGSACAVLGE